MASDQWLAKNQAKLDAQAAKIAELETAEWYGSLTREQLSEVRFYADIECFRKRCAAQTALLARAVEAMKKVPHLWLGEFDYVSGSVHDTEPCKEDVEREMCARLGGRCAFDKLIEEIERG